MEKQFAVYILSNQKCGTLYVGLTSNLVQRIYQHKHKLFEGFTEKYDVDKLVYYELHETAETAIAREKNIKRWKRNWKLNLIIEHNPKWDDLYDQIVGV